MKAFNQQPIAAAVSAFSAVVPQLQRRLSNTAAEFTSCQQAPGSNAKRSIPAIRAGFGFKTPQKTAGSSRINRAAAVKGKTRKCSHDIMSSTSLPSIREWHYVWTAETVEASERLIGDDDRCDRAGKPRHACCRGEHLKPRRATRCAAIKTTTKKQKNDTDYFTLQTMPR